MGLRARNNSRSLRSKGAAAAREGRGAAAFYWTTISPPSDLSASKVCGRAAICCLFCALPRGAERELRESASLVARKQKAARGVQVTHRARLTLATPLSETLYGSVRPEALRPRLSTGVPFSAMPKQLRLCEGNRELSENECAVKKFPPQGFP